LAKKGEFLMKDENSDYSTEDIHLAIFLKLKGIELLEIVPLAPYRSQFIFSHVPKQLLDTFLSSPVEVPLRNCINEYRHLLREVRTRVREVQK
jgi:hypothetical protein